MTSVIAPPAMTRVVAPAAMTRVVALPAMTKSMLRRPPKVYVRLLGVTYQS
mgnify:CR=1